MIRGGGDVARLLTELRHADPIRRDTAVARLRVVGSPAIDALGSLAASDGTLDTRIAALKALEGIDDPRVADRVITLVDDAEPRLAVAAVTVLRQWIAREAGTRVLEVLTRVSLDRSRDATVRLAALDAIGELPRALVAPVLEQAALGAPATSAADDVLAIQEWLAGHADAPLSELHALIVQIGANARAETSSARRQQWLRAHGAAHAALAARGSKVAVYDLRETFDAAKEPLPLDFLAAVTAVGDATCLEPMARTWAALPHEPWWRERLSEAAAEIIHRTRLSGRSAAVKRIRARWPGFV